jgi:PST family polysaccharide transporter
MRGGVYLGARQSIGLLMSVGGSFLVMRTLGPREYGYYAAALGFMLPLQFISQLGIGVFLIRREKDPDVETLHVAATLLALLGAAAFLLGALTLPPMSRWSRLEEAALPTLALYASLPLATVAAVPVALLDRRLDYRRVAWTELSGQFAFYAVAFSCAVVRPTVWAPVIGWWAQQLVLLVGGCFTASYAPRPGWNAGLVREMIRYGGGYSAAISLYQLRRALNPLIVGRYLGAEAVAAVSLSFQLATQLSFVAVSAWRLSTAALARVQSDSARLLRAIEEGMRLQVPAVAPFLLLFAWVAPSIVPLLLGPEWRQVPVVFPFVAGAYLFGAIFTMQTSALFVVRQNLAVASTHALQMILLAAAGLVAVPILGLVGWGVAELVMLVAFVYLHRATALAIGRPRYGATLALAAACSVGMLTDRLGLVALAPLAIVSILVQPWRDLSSVLQALRAARAETRVAQTP